MADDLPLMEWLQDHIWPAEAAHASAQFVYDGTRLACAEMLLGGITCFNDMYFYPEAAATAASEMGMRAVLGITAIEFPTAYASDADDYINKGLAARETLLDNPLINFCLAPHAPYTVSDKTFERILTLSEQLNLPIHCHIHETRQEIEDALKQNQIVPLARLHQLGLLGPGFTAQLPTSNWPAVLLLWQECDNLVSMSDSAPTGQPAIIASTYLVKCALHRY